jgi:hypothetical protein
MEHSQRPTHNPALRCITAKFQMALAPFFFEALSYLKPPLSVPGRLEGLGK